MQLVNFKPDCPVHYPDATSILCLANGGGSHSSRHHITRSMAGVVLVSVELVKTLVKQTTTTTGLKVFARVSKKVYETGKQVAKDFYDWANIKADKKLGQWNYVISPVM